MDNSNDYEVDLTLAQLPNLIELGIEETDRGVCLDTFENRRILRANKYQWRPIFTSEGEPTDLIQAFSPEQLRNHALSDLEDHKWILSDPRSKNSDYIRGYDLLLEERAEEVVPLWVLSATRKFSRVEEDREAKGRNVMPSLASYPGRCSATLMTGVRCRYWHGGRTVEQVDGEGYCRIHLNQQRVPVNLRAKARARMESAMLGMVENLEALANGAESEPVRLKATTEYLDRIGIRGGFEVDTTVTETTQTAGELLAQRLAKLRPKAVEPAETDTEEIEEAVIVEDEDGGQR